MRVSLSDASVDHHLASTYEPRKSWCYDYHITSSITKIANIREPLVVNYAAGALELNKKTREKQKNLTGIVWITFRSLL
ncbi:hypothetical protein GCM10012290_16270 [Halolactibacillus alkaliphilus]|uniref:Uncharacterized protein n=1 Tax=Halolactibacillus alkaliphilus TaxID=442899 RepID=A0A511X1M5_9BACI|nr:hypothetical protein HAL01_13230 [Halolactibacillus alkaliphilus]GGN71407.1 hypothetical protein GCM10012290_16270 [Halolactibacillus alkaliphilus]